MEPYLLLFLAIALAYIAFQVGALRSQIENSQAMLQKLLQLQGVEWGRAVEPSDEVKALAATAGAQIEAIRAYRQQTGLGLKQAKAAVERLSHTDPGNA